MAAADADALSERLGQLAVGGETATISDVRRKKDFRCMERVDGRMVNVLGGLELHCGVFSAADQRRIVDYVCELQELGRKGMLLDRTYLEPQKWMKGKGRITIQFGCCYNYATDKHGNPPGIIRDEEVDPIPPLLKDMIKRMVEWHVLPPTCVPNSCIVNIYDKDDCIPPHIDHHDFVRPFCTVSFLSECSILFGRDLRARGPGEFVGPARIPLPVGSVLIMQGNGADVAKHCVPAVPAKRISITFRKMDESKIPYGFVPDPDLQNLRPIALSSPMRSPAQRLQQTPPSQIRPARVKHAPAEEAEHAPRQVQASHEAQRDRPVSAAAPPAVSVQEEPGTSQQTQEAESRQPASASAVPEIPRRRLGPQSSMKQILSGLLKPDDFPPLGAAPACARRSYRQ